MILNLTGNHLVTPGAVYPASGPAPVVQPLDIPPDYPTPAEILADLGVPLGALAVLDPATLGSRPGPIRVAPLLDRIMRPPSTARCIADGCDLTATTRRLCDRHYAAAHRQGRLDAYPRLDAASPGAKAGRSR